MKKLLMAAVALICMTMTSVVLTSCGSDKDDSPINKEYTLKISLQIIAQGELTSTQLNFLNTNFKDKETKNNFTSFYDAKKGTDNSVDVALTGIASNKIYAKGGEYKVYFKLFDSSNSQVYQKTIYVKDEGYKLED
jgi:hypothetical protein